jgi:hypothetical protein
MDFEALDRGFENYLEKFPKKREELVNDAGQMLYDEVKNNITKGINSNSGTRKKALTGNLKKGVKMFVGSKGGYVAIRPDYRIAPHTHLLENGRIVTKKGEQRHIPGWHMYRNALNSLENELIQKAEKMLDESMGDF